MTTVRVQIVALFAGRETFVTGTRRGRGHFQGTDNVLPLSWVLVTWGFSFKRLKPHIYVHELFWMFVTFQLCLNLYRKEQDPQIGSQANTNMTHLQRMGPSAVGNREQQGQPGRDRASASSIKSGMGAGLAPRSWPVTAQGIPAPTTWGH